MWDWIKGIFLSPDGAGGASPAVADPPPAPVGDPPPAPPAAPAPPPAGKPRPTIYAQLPKGRELRDGFLDLDTLDKIVAHAETLEDKLKDFETKSKRSIIVPDKDSKPEEIKDFLAKMGVPETAEGYGLDPKKYAEFVGEAKAKERIASLTELAHRAGWPKRTAEQVTALLAGIAMLDKQEADAAKAARAANFQAEILKAADGDKEKANLLLGRATRFLQQHVGDRELIQRMAERGDLDDPVLVQKLAAVDEYFDDDKFVEGGDGHHSKGKAIFGYSDAWKKATGGKA